MISSDKRKTTLGILLLITIISVMILQRTGHIDIKPFTDLIRSSQQGWIIFTITMIVAIVLGFPAYVFYMSSGYLFGPLYGFIMIMAAANIASIIAFSISRHLFHDYFHKNISNKRFLRWSRIKDQKKLGYLAISLRIVHIIPSSILNYGLGLTKIKTMNYVLITAIFMIPEAFAYVFLGSSLIDALSLKFRLALGLFAALLVILLVVGQKIRSSNK